jgi:hypothetical protein
VIRKKSVLTDFTRENETFRTLVFFVFATFVPSVALAPYPLVFLGQLFQFRIGEMLNINHLILGLINRLDDFVELQMDSACVPVLRVLDQKHHEKRHDRRAGINNELPGVRILEVRSGDHPNDNYQRRYEKGPLGSDPVRRFRREYMEA